MGGDPEAGLEGSNSVLDGPLAGSGEVGEPGDRRVDGLGPAPQVFGEGDVDQLGRCRKVGSGQDGVRAGGIGPGPKQLVASHRRAPVRSLRLQQWIPCRQRAKKIASRMAGGRRRRRHSRAEQRGPAGDRKTRAERARPAWSFPALAQILEPLSRCSSSWSAEFHWGYRKAAAGPGRRVRELGFESGQGLGDLGRVGVARGAAILGEFDDAAQFEGFLKGGYLVGEGHTVIVGRPGGESCALGAFWGLRRRNGLYVYYFLGLAGWDWSIDATVASLFDVKLLASIGLPLCPGLQPIRNWGTIRGHPLPCRKNSSKPDPEIL